MGNQQKNSRLQKYADYLREYAKTQNYDSSGWRVLYALQTRFLRLFPELKEEVQRAKEGQLASKVIDRLVLGDEIEEPHADLPKTT